MDAGRVTANGPCHQVLNAYENSFIQRSEERARRDQQHDLGATTTGVRIETLDGQSIATVPLGTSWRIRVTIAITRSLPQFVVGVGLKLNDGTPVQTAWNPPADVSPGNYEATFVQDRVVLGIGSYAVLVGLASQNRSIEQIEATHVEVSSENAVGFFPVSAGVGAVLNSMTTELRRLA